MPKLTDLQARPGHQLWLRYDDGAEGTVDLSDLAGRGVFALWDEPGGFERVEIGPGGAPTWSKQVDVCPDALYMKLTGKSPQEVFPRLAEFRESA